MVGIGQDIKALLIFTSLVSTFLRCRYISRSLGALAALKWINGRDSERKKNRVGGLGVCKKPTNRPVCEGGWTSQSVFPSGWIARPGGGGGR